MHSQVGGKGWIKQYLHQIAWIKSTSANGFDCECWFDWFVLGILLGFQVVSLVFLESSNMQKHSAFDMPVVKTS